MIFAIGYGCAQTKKIERELNAETLRAQRKARIGVPCQGPSIPAKHAERRIRAPRPTHRIAARKKKPAASVGMTENAKAPASEGGRYKSSSKLRVVLEVGVEVLRASFSDALRMTRFRGLASERGVLVALLRGWLVSGICRGGRRGRGGRVGRV